MPVQLTSKERQLLNDQKNHEQICIQKYQNYASQATDAQLKQLFQTHAQHEQQHLNTINSILSGQVPSMNQSQGQQSQSSSQTGSMQSSSQSGMQNTSQSSMQNSSQSSMQSSSQTGSSAKSGANQADAMLCNDMLMTEKYVSGAYDTAIFEFTDSNVRQALNHIQKEEQKHGEDLFNYMSSNGMYNVQQ